MPLKHKNINDGVFPAIDLPDEVVCLIGKNLNPRGALSLALAAGRRKDSTSYIMSENLKNMPHNNPKLVKKIKDKLQNMKHPSDETLSYSNIDDMMPLLGCLKQGAIKHALEMTRHLQVTSYQLRIIGQEVINTKFKPASVHFRPLIVELLNRMDQESQKHERKTDKEEGTTTSVDEFRKKALIAATKASNIILTQDILGMIRRNGQTSPPPFLNDLLSKIRIDHDGAGISIAHLLLDHGARPYSSFWKSLIVANDSMSNFRELAERVVNIHITRYAIKFDSQIKPATIKMALENGNMWTLDLLLKARSKQFPTFDDHRHYSELIQTALHLGNLDAINHLRHAYFQYEAHKSNRTGVKDDLINFGICVKSDNLQFLQCVLTKLIRLGKNEALKSLLQMNITKDITHGIEVNWDSSSLVWENPKFIHLTTIAAKYKQWSTLKLLVKNQKPVSWDLPLYFIDPEQEQCWRRYTRENESIQT